MKLSDFSYTKPNKPAIDYKWFLDKVTELDNYKLEANSCNQVIGLDTNLNYFEIGYYDLAVPDQFVDCKITLVKLPNNWVTVYHSMKDGIMYFFERNNKLLCTLNGEEAILGDGDLRKSEDYYNIKILETIKSVLN